MYQALYRKWRPTTFSEVVGQSHITETLQRQVAEGRTGHAYLFTGTRGTGKTTCARILAKAINCLDPQDGAPCNQCEACRGIDEGRLLDITELDAASNSGVDSVRALREEAVYTPSVLKKRVYIIDEVHALSPPAFNALLKILEEPPEHLVFILATTELHKVPATILSRCQRFSFKRILPADIARQLLKISQAEHISLTPDGADILARMAGGALRDGLSLLDQCRSYEGTLDSAAILDLLGLAGGIQTSQLMGYVLSRDTQQALLLFDQLYRGGKDTAALLSELSDLCRDLMIRQAAPQGGEALLTGLYSRETLEQLGQGLSLKRLVYLNRTLQEAKAALSDSSSPRTDAELCLIRLCDETLCGDLTAICARLDRLEKGGVPVSVQMPPIQSAPQSAPPPAPAPRSGNVSKAPSAQSISQAAQTVPQRAQPVPPAVQTASKTVQIDPKTVPASPKTVPAAPQTLPPQEQNAPSGGEDRQIWGRLIEHYKAQLRVDKRVFLNMATGVLENGLLQVVCQSDMAKNYLDTPDVTQVLQQVTEQAAGHPVRVVFRVENGRASAPRRAQPRPAAPRPAPAAPQPPEEDERPPLPEEAPPLPTELPPWEEPAPNGGDRLEELISEGSQLDGFTIN